MPIKPLKATYIIKCTVMPNKSNLFISLSFTAIKASNRNTIPLINITNLINFFKILKLLRFSFMKRNFLSKQL